MVWHLEEESAEIPWQGLENQFCTDWHLLKGEGFQIDTKLAFIVKPTFSYPVTMLDTIQ